MYCTQSGDLRDDMLNSTEKGRPAHESVKISISEANAQKTVVQRVATTVKRWCEKKRLTLCSKKNAPLVSFIHHKMLYKTFNVAKDQYKKLDDKVQELGNELSSFISLHPELNVTSDVVVDEVDTSSFGYIREIASEVQVLMMDYKEADRKEREAHAKAKTLCEQYNEQRRIMKETPSSLTWQRAEALRDEFHKVESSKKGLYDAAAKADKKLKEFVRGKPVVASAARDSRRLAQERFRSIILNKTNGKAPQKKSPLVLNQKVAIENKVIVGNVGDIDGQINKTAKSIHNKKQVVVDPSGDIDRQINEVTNGIRKKIKFIVGPDEDIDGQTNENTNGIHDGMQVFNGQVNDVVEQDGVSNDGK
ncbi:unnamed protein product [Caenorhabditis auriculariae]|uniref:Uncharacterized protein n=1 Tax=Caenorhabditis auriculariae TaxID=2777116 RepID=A0A8S1H797_9PELO|nr:unnamed protein product [Caenorhabditis auriculariae]